MSTFAPFDIAMLVALALCSLSFLVAMWRMLSGPNSLDRLIAMDAMVAIIQCGLAAYLCLSLDTTVSNSMIVVALMGFISTVAITRFRRKDTQL